MARARSSYDAPFQRGLVSFDCAVDFNWKQHLVDVLGTLPSTAEPVVEGLQAIPHRVFVDRAGAIVSAQPKAPDVSSIPHANELETMLQTMISGGLNAWIPASTNVLLPIGPTNYSFMQDGDGHKLTMNGEGVRGQLFLDSELRLTKGVTDLPEPLSFSTEFTATHDGYVLSKIATANTTAPDVPKEVSFQYTYKIVDGFQLPAEVVVTRGLSETDKAANPDIWRYKLSDCKTMKGAVVRAGPQV